MKIRSESDADVATIEALTEEAFRTAPHAGYTEQFIVNALRKAGQLSVSLVAEIDGKIVGHVALSPVSISDGSKHWYGLGPISVLPKYQKNGIGSKLMEAAIIELNKLSAAGCVLLGEPQFYSRFGFRVMPELVLPDVPAEYFMALPLGSEIPKGDVRYHEAFNAQE